MPKQNNAPLVLVDGSSYLFRAFYAIKADLRTATGKPTAAVRGVISMIRRLIKDYPESTIAVVFDAKGKTFRHQMFPQYKANRMATPEDLQVQIEPIHRIIEAMGLPLLIVDGVEADDVIGARARQATAQQIETVISTGDKDMAQLVSEHVTLINTMDGVTMDQQGVVNKFGVPAERIIDLLALVGDSSDNIPGVPKCGPKTAQKWLNQYGSFQGVLENADQIGGKVGENLRDVVDQLPLSYQLAAIKTDVPLDVTPTSLAHREPDTDALLAWFNELEFKGWAEELTGGQEEKVVPAAKHQATYETLLTAQDFDRWLQKIKAAPLVAVDTETTSLNYMEAKLVGLSFAVVPHEAAYLPIAHDYLGAPTQLDFAQVLEQLKPFLEDAQRHKVGQNLKYDMNVLANHGIQLAGVAEDTMLQSYVLDSTQRHDLDSLAMRLLDHQTIHFEALAGKGAKQLTFNQIALEKASDYAAEDADITLQLCQMMQPRLAAEKTLLRVYKEIELPLVPVLSRIECKGALVDAKLLGEQSKALEKRLAAIEKQVFELAGETFNLGSPKQLQAILYDKLALPVLKKTPKGQPSTAEAVLQELALDYPLPKVILEYRSFSKLKSTYTDKLPRQINGNTGRIHTSYHQAVTATGRLSSSDPNLQNIPIRTEEGRKIRKAFIAPPGYKLIAADYSQIELRIMAHLSQDAGLLDAFAHNMDVHRATASEVFATPFEKVTAAQRRSAKAINFGLIYGMSAFGLGRQLGLSRKEAQAYIDRYFERYPGVLRYMDNIRRDAADKGYVETLFGRRLYLPEINARNALQRQAAERTAINAPMQGSAADIIKRAMIQVDRWLLREQPDAQMIMQVHDELVLEVAEDVVDQVQQQVIELMSSTVTLDVPLVVDVGVGDNWDEAH